MKRRLKFLSFWLLLVLATATTVFNVAAAENTLFVYSIDGNSMQSAPLDNIQRLKFAGDNLLLKITGGSESSYSLATVGKISFKDYGTSGISSLQNKVEINLYPNPSVDYVNIDSPVAIMSWALFDLGGKMLKQSVHTSQIQVDDLFAGIYLLKINTANGIVIKKIIKQ